MADPSGDLRVVGRVVKAHGLRGELVVEPSTDQAEQRFTPGAVLSVSGVPARSTLTITAARWHSGRLLVTADEVTDRDTAEALRRGVLRAAASDADIADEDEFHDHQLEGLRRRAHRRHRRRHRHRRLARCRRRAPGARGAPTASCSSRSSRRSSRRWTWPAAGSSSTRPRACSTPPEDAPPEEDQSSDSAISRISPPASTIDTCRSESWWRKVYSVPSTDPVISEPAAARHAPRRTTAWRPARGRRSRRRR